MPPTPRPEFVRRVLEALGEIDKTVTYLENHPDEAIHLGFGLELEERAIVGAADPEVAEINRRSRFERAQAIHRGQAALGRIAAQGVDTPLDDDEVVGLKVILAITARPAILVIGDRLIEPPRSWRQLLEIPDSIARVSDAVGWIRGRGAPIGTGFVVADGQVMTNKHVAESLAPGDTATIAFSYRFDDQAARFRLFDLRQHAELDLALFRVDPAPVSGQGQLPTALPLAVDAPPTVAGREVYTVGFPREPRPGLIDPQLRDRLFARVYDVKRLQPGVLRELDGLELRHDCSTLGGNSGSPLVDLEEGDLVIGLHFEGVELERNVAVPLWELAGDPLLAGLNWDA